MFCPSLLDCHPKKITGFNLPAPPRPPQPHTPGHTPVCLSLLLPKNIDVFKFIYSIYYYKPQLPSDNRTYVQYTHCEQNPRVKKCLEYRSSLLSFLFKPNRWMYLLLMHSDLKNDFLNLWSPLTKHTSHWNLIRLIDLQAQISLKQCRCPSHLLLIKSHGDKV